MDKDSPKSLDLSTANDSFLLIGTYHDYYYDEQFLGVNHDTVYQVHSSYIYYGKDSTIININMVNKNNFARFSIPDSGKPTFLIPEYHHQTKTFSLTSDSFIYEVHYNHVHTNDDRETYDRQYHLAIVR